jgi:hypothetical protein
MEMELDFGKPGDEGFERKIHVHVRKGAAVSPQHAVEILVNSN